MNRFQRVAAATSVAVAASLGLMAPATAGQQVGEPCGVSVTYGPWKDTGTGNGYQRGWTWTYHNCASAAVRKGIDVQLNPDPCLLVAAQGYKTYYGAEMQIGGVGAYRGTYSC